MIACTNPFLGIHSPVMPIGVEAEGAAQLLRLESAGGRIVTVPDALPVDSLRQLCGGTSWLASQFPPIARGSDQPLSLPGFDQPRAARALVEACAHAQARRTQPKRSGGYAW